jgi:hypothetical protein
MSFVLLCQDIFDFQALVGSALKIFFSYQIHIIQNIDTTETTRQDRNPWEIQKQEFIILHEYIDLRIPTDSTIHTFLGA